VLVTGARGFIGRNLALRLGERGNTRTLEFRREHAPEMLDQLVAEADVVFHLAGVNRPESPDDFRTGNVGLTERLTAVLAGSTRTPHLIFVSSIQAAADNPYGESKREAEQVVARYAAEAKAAVTVFRLKNVFGKWCRPNYNSVVATFCHNIANDLPISIHDPAGELELVHIDDVVAALIDTMDARAPLSADPVPDGIPSRRITLGALAEVLRAFRAEPDTLLMPDLSERFLQQLYATYVSYLPQTRWGYTLDQRVDPRGSLAEFIKSCAFGQIFVSSTAPGVTRGNHYHHTKVEKFLVVAGMGRIRLRHVDGGDLIEFQVLGRELRVVQIPPGYTHNITNIGDDEMITLFWSSEILDRELPDTAFLPVDPVARDAR
jgi:UDP-2-acetamido-2,6-beta-L-arabino-hexul-4-ose reductase